MPTVTAAISALATFAASVPGIKNSYDLAAIPEKISREKLPCAVVIPEVGQEPGFKTLAFAGNAPELDFSVRQIVLYDEAAPKDVRKVLPGMITLLDNYLAALKASPYLGSIAAPPVHQPAQVKISVGVIEWAGVSYHALEFTHALVIYL